MRKKPQPLPVKSSLAVEELPIDSITEYPNNSRMHTVEQIELIAKSITEFGFTNPVLVDGDNELIAGHARKQAAQTLGMATIPAIRLGHLTPTQKRALVIADNKIAITGTQWDYTLLKLELSELKLADFDLQLSGWSEAEIDQLFAPPNAKAEDEWVGMPEFEQPDKMAFHTIAVHFKDQEAIDEFARLIGQTIARTTKFTWFPRIADRTFIDQRYAASSTDEP